MRRQAWLLCSTLVLSACGLGQREASHTDVTLGTILPATDRPEVVYIEQELPGRNWHCTATFINDSQAITAAHCLIGAPAKDVRIYLMRATGAMGSNLWTRQVEALSFVPHPDFSWSAGVGGVDVMVLNFPTGTAPATATMAKKTPKVGSQVSLIGFGDNTESLGDQGAIDGTGRGVKRVGQNQIDSIGRGTIELKGNTGTETKPEPSRNSLGSGDSGGPLFYNQQMIGVASGITVARGLGGRQYVRSTYIDINSSKIQSFLRLNLKSSL